MRVEIFYFSGCPNHGPAVDRVREALEQEGAAAEMIEVEVNDASTAPNSRLAAMGITSRRGARSQG